MKVTVRVPASTSNLGPGYDSLGMALSLQAKFTFEPSDELVIEGCPEAYRNADNLVMQGFRMVCEKADRPVPAVHLVIDSEVPVARGLGSSSTCIAGGMAAANAMLGNPFTTDDLFQLCTAFEGHPDNAAPAFLGGLTARGQGRRRSVLARSRLALRCRDPELRGPHRGGSQDRQARHRPLGRRSHDVPRHRDGEGP